MTAAKGTGQARVNHFHLPHVNLSGKHTGYESFYSQRYNQRGHQYFVGGRIQNSAEDGLHLELTGQIPICLSPMKCNK